MELLRRKELARKLCVSVSMVDKWRADPKSGMPRPVMMGRIPGWDFEEVMNWLKDRRQVTK